MADKQETKESISESLQQVISLLEKHKLVENLVHRQGSPIHDSAKQDLAKQDLVELLVHKQNLNELQKKLDALHPADVAHILEALPLSDRLNLWAAVRALPSAPPFNKLAT